MTDQSEAATGPMRNPSHPGDLEAVMDLWWDGSQIAGYEHCP